MGYVQPSDDFFTYESRLASFRKAHPVSRRRASNTSLKGAKSLKWPHKFLSASDLAKSGFYYLPSLTSPDNVVCFLCQKSLDGWEETDDPYVEHLRHSPNCGWAITTSIGRLSKEWSGEHPNSNRIIEARKATFADKWPHEDKKGWKCHIKQMIEAGWKYTPTLQSDDMVTCSYCALTLNNWEKNDNPSDKHHESSPNCPFFVLINNHNASPQIKKTSPKRTRASWTSRLSAQSNLTVCSNESREASFLAEANENAVTISSTSGHKMALERKITQIKSMRLRVRKNEGVEATKQEEISEKAQNLNRGRKRISEECQLVGDKRVDLPTKRRTARNRAGKIIIPSAPEVTVASQPIIKAQQKKANSTLNGSLINVTSPINDSDIERELEVDLDRSISGDEAFEIKDSTNIVKSNQIDIGDSALEAGIGFAKENKKSRSNLRATRSTSSSAQKIIPREAEEFKTRQVENQTYRLNTADNPDHNISSSHSSPPVAPAKKGKASTRNVMRKLPSRNTRSSARSSNSHNSSINVNFSTVEIVIESRKSIERKTNNSSTPLKSTLSSKSSEDEGNAKHREEKNSELEITEILQASEVLETNNLIQRSTSYDNEHEQEQEQEQNIEPDIALNLIDYKDRSDLKSPLGTIQLEDSNSIRPPNVKSLRKSPTSKNKTRETTKTNSPEIDRSIIYSPKSLMISSKTSSPRRRDATPQSSPPCSDAENKPPSMKLSRDMTTPPATRRVVIIDNTPIRSVPSKNSLFIGLQTEQPWKAVDPETILGRSPSSDRSASDVVANDTNAIRNSSCDILLSGNRLEQAIQRRGLTSIEEKMTVEEWICHNALIAEESLKRECERMVSKFEREGTRAIRVLEGVRCVE